LPNENAGHPVGTAPAAPARVAPWKKCVRWLWSRRWRVGIVCLVAGFAVLNALAFMHARAMTHFVSSGVRTARPELLNFGQKLKVHLTGVTISKPLNLAAPDSLGLEFETHRFAGGAGELEAWYVPHDEPRGLVLMFHGYASCKSEILREAAALHELGYATFLLDFRGSGGSSGFETSVGVHEADDVACAWEYAAEHWPAMPVKLFGQSMGSSAVLRAIAEYDLRPTAVVLECPFDRLVSTVGNRFHSMGLPATPFAHLLVFWGGVTSDFNGFRHNPVEYAKSVPAPTLMLHGSRDTRVTLDQAKTIFENLPCPKQFEVFDDAGHESYIARDATRWNQLVHRFLLEIEQP
jgi:alpha-beta hydrolase superfamily lysophospholipase